MSCGLMLKKNDKERGVGMKTFDVPRGELSFCKSKELKDRCLSKGF